MAAWYQAWCQGKNIDRNSYGHCLGHEVLVADSLLQSVCTGKGFIKDVGQFTGFVESQRYRLGCHKVKWVTPNPTADGSSKTALALFPVTVPHMIDTAHWPTEAFAFGATSSTIIPSFHLTGARYVYLM